MGVDAARNQKSGGFGWPALAGAVVLGVLLAAAAIKSAPPMPGAPTKSYPEEQPFDTCRPPFRAS